MNSSGATAELRCGECGYGIMVDGEPPACPMCRARAWEAPDPELTPRGSETAG